MPIEVFLSHSSKDASFVANLAAMLRGHGIPVWYSGTNLIGGQQWIDEIGEALKRCDWFVVVLSPDAIDSLWVPRELTYALKQKRYQKRIVPLMHRTCDPDQLSWALSDYQYVDFTSNYEDGCRALLRIWGIGYVP